MNAWPATQKLEPLSSFFTAARRWRTTLVRRRDRKRDFAKAKNLITEAGYKGEKIVVLDAVDTRRRMRMR